MNVSNTDENRLGLCQVCSNIRAKYSCPRCEVATCCLKCFKTHKSELECNGERDKTKFISIHKFTDLDLSNDYKFLEEINRTVRSFKEDRLKTFMGFKKRLSHNCLRLRTIAKSKQITLKFLPSNFARHAKNTSSFQLNQLFWHIDWIFVNADNLLLTDDHISEKSRIICPLQKHLLNEDTVIQDRLQFYRSAGLSDVKLLIRAEGKPGTKYYELDPSSNFQTNLKNKIVIEYPTIFVVLKDHLDGSELIDSDDEDTSQTVNASAVITKLIKKCEKEETLNNSLKNLLFITEVPGGDSE